VGAASDPLSGRLDPRIDAYIGLLRNWQQAICEPVRHFAHAADPHVAETIREKPW